MKRYKVTGYIDVAVMTIDIGYTDVTSDLY